MCVKVRDISKQILYLSLVDIDRLGSILSLEVIELFVLLHETHL